MYSLWIIWMIAIIYILNRRALLKSTLSSLEALPLEVHLEPFNSFKSGEVCFQYYSAVCLMLSGSALHDIQVGFRNCLWATRPFNVPLIKT